MPELPDVENYRRYLEETALGATIAKVRADDPLIIEGHGPQAFADRLERRRLQSTHRHGKHLLVRLDDGRWLALHFGMTGRLAYFKDLDDDPPFDRLRFDLDNGYHLALVDRRRLARATLAEDADRFIAEQGLGPDALDPAFDARAFAMTLGGSRAQVKAALMDQHLIAGIGNIYSDEVLFQARLHPRTKLSELDGDRLAALYQAMREVLETAIDVRRWPSLTARARARRRPASRGAAKPPRRAD